MKHLISRLKQLSNDHPEGLTVELKLQLVTKGYVVSIPETQDSFGNEGLEHTLNLVLEHGYCIGGWLNDENGKFYWDASVIVDDLEEAKRLGRKFGQLAIFDLNEQRLYWL